MMKEHLVELLYRDCKQSMLIEKLYSLGVSLDVLQTEVWDITAAVCGVENDDDHLPCLVHGHAVAQEFPVFEDDDIVSYDLLFEEYCNLCRDLIEKGCFENKNQKDEILQLEARTRLDRHIDRLILHAEHQKRKAKLTSDK